MVDFGRLRIAFYFEVTSKGGAHDRAQWSGGAQKFLNPNTAMPLKSRPEQAGADCEQGLLASCMSSRNAVQ
jgi:hypothetical protein